MEFTISRETLLKPLQFAGSVVERRQTMPILSNVRLALEDGVLSVTGTDLEVEVVGRAVLEQAGSEGQTTAPARKLLEICKSLPEGASLQIAAEDGRLQIVSGRSRFSLATLPASDFPSMEGEDPACCFSLEADELKRLIDRTAFAMANQDVRYYLNGMLWEVTDERFRTVATDGHRLALAEHWGEYPGGGERRQVIVPRKGVIELARILAAEGGDIRLSLGENYVRVEAPDFLYLSKLIEGAYPDYERVIPRDLPRYLVVEREPFRQALSRAAILTNEKFKGIRLNIERDRLRILANNPEQEEAEEELSVEYSGEGALEIGFNVTYLLDVLGVIEGSRVRMEFRDAGQSVLLVDPEQAEAMRHVVMPMRL